ncbi:MAG: hypothetical protein LBM96_02380 [Methanobrevibacter sp.]|jgi:transposase-like protein|nr:hypothetical protein [Candidatus Methanoflexus mossambicus]
MIVECPYCGANNEVNDNDKKFVCHACNNTIEYKNNKLLTLTCPKCEVESKVVDINSYYHNHGAVCHNCGNFIPENKKFENKRPLWKKKATGKEIATNAGIMAVKGGVGIILAIIFLAIFIFLMLIL